MIIDVLLSHTSDPPTLLMLAMAAGLQLDLTQRIVNVHWGEGLAVEFFAADT